VGSLRVHNIGRQQSQENFLLIALFLIGLGTALNISAKNKSSSAPNQAPNTPSKLDLQDEVALENPVELARKKEERQLRIVLAMLIGTTTALPLGAMLSVLIAGPIIASSRDYDNLALAIMGLFSISFLVGGITYIIRSVKTDERIGQLLIRNMYAQGAFAALATILAIAGGI